MRLYAAMKTRLAVLALSALALTTCIPPDQGGQLGPVEMSFGDELPQHDVYVMPSFSGVETRRGVIITDFTAFQAAWDLMFANYSPKERPQLPYIEFKDNVILLASAGPTPTQLLWFRITKVRASTEHLEVLVESQWPQCGGAPVTTNPVHIVSVPRAATQAAFTFVDNTQPCS